MAAEDYIDFDDPFEDSRDPYLRTQRRTCINPLPGAPNNGKYWEPEDDEELERLWERGYGLEACAKKFGRTKVAIIARLEKLGLDPDETKRTLSTLKVKSTLTKKVNTAMTQNMQHLLALLQKGYTTVAVEFVNDSNVSNPQQYTYKVPESVASTLTKGDLLVVPARKSFAVVKVVEVHDTPQINVKEPLALKWIVQKVDRTAYDDQTEREAKAIQQVEVAERRRAQEEALQTLLGTAEDREAFLALINVK